MGAQGRVRSISRTRSFVRIFSVLSLSIFCAALALSTLILIWVPLSPPPVSLAAGKIDEVDRGSDAARAGLRVGDTLAPNTPFFVREALGNSFYARPTHISFDVVRDGRLQHIALTVRTFTWDFNPGGPEIAVLIAAILAFLICVLIGTYVVLVRPMGLTWLFYLFCIGTIPPFAAAEILCTIPLPLGYILQMLRVTLYVAGLLALLGFALRFPNSESYGWRKRVEAALPILAMPFLGYWWFMWSYEQLYPAAFNYGVLPYVDAMVSTTVALLSVGSVIGTYRSAGRLMKQRIKWAVIGIVLGSAALSCRAILTSVNQFWNLEWQLGAETIVASFFAPLAIAYAILRHRVVDIRFVVNRAIVYAAMTTILVGLLASSYWVIERLLQQTQLAEILQLAVAIVIGISLQQSYKGIESAINRWFFKRVYAAQEHLTRLAEMLSYAESTQALEELLTAEPVNALELTAAAIFRRRDDGRFERSAAVGWSDYDNTRLASDDPLVLHLHAKHDALSLDEVAFRDCYLSAKTNNAEEAVPIFSRGVLTAIALYGAHCSGTKIDPIERTALEKLAAPAGRAYDSLRVRLENVRRLSDILERQDEAAYDELHCYLAGEAIEGIPERTRSALTACAVVPDATEQDIITATEDASSALRLHEMASGSALIRRDGNGTYSVHPLIAHILLQRCGALRTQMLLKCAQASKERRNHGRAATLYAAAGMTEAASDELEAMYSESDAPAILRTDQYAEFCASLQTELVLSRPNVWLKRNIARTFKDDIRHSAREALLVLEDIHGQTNVANEGLIRAWSSWLLLHAGDRNPLFSLPGEPDALPAAVRTFSHLIHAEAHGCSGKTAECERELLAANDLFVLCDEFAAIHATIRACRIERVSGRWHEERTLLSYATELFAAVKSRMALWSAAEAAVGAWLCANRALLERCVADLNGRIERDDAPALRHLSSSLAGRFDEPNGIESARHLAYAFLAQACHAPDAEGARRCAERADAAAMLAHEPFLSTLTSVARAMCDHSRRLQHLARAVDASELVESPALQQAVRAIIAGDNDAGMLSPLLGMLVQHQYSSGSISIGMASCAIKRNGELLQLSERETALAVAIARRPEPTSAIQLAELLWPDLDEAAGLHAVQTYIHRLRQRFCDPEAIELVAQGYRYRADTKVDLWEMERFIASLPAGPLEHFSALVLAAFVRDLNVSPPGYTIGWEWFISTRLRVEDLVRAAEYRMARDALKAGLLGEALACAKRIIGRDELDEEAWEVVIRCCIAAGDKLAASREFRRYREIVLRELNQEPSKDLRSLIGADA